MAAIYKYQLVYQLFTVYITLTSAVYTMKKIFIEIILICNNLFYHYSMLICINFSRVLNLLAET